MRIVNGQVVLTAAQQQELILGRALAAQLRIPVLEEENERLRARVADLESELPKLRAESERLAVLIAKPPRTRKKKP